MQEALRKKGPPHPELEVELQEEIGKIQPEVAQGTVTKSETNHHHPLDACAHGHIKKGGITVMAQSIAAKRECQLFLSSNGSGSGSGRPSPNNSKSSSLNFYEQSSNGKCDNLAKDEAYIQPSMDQCILDVTKVEILPSETCARDRAENVELVATL